MLTSAAKRELKLHPVKSLSPDYASSLLRLVLGMSESCILRFGLDFKRCKIDAELRLKLCLLLPLS